MTEEERNAFHSALADSEYVLVGIGGEWKKEKRSKEEIQFILTKEFQRFCKDLEKKGVEIVGKDVKIYNENQSASAKGKIILIQKAEERRNTELIHPKGVN